jgi:anaerobic magnesium-protoporphyrin IX monomethyl ester cyclase
MRNAGLSAIKYGVESSDLKILEASKKKLDLKKLENTINITRSLGIKYHLTFSIGLPGETWDSVRRTIDYAFFLNPDSLQFSIVTPFPGTEYYNIARERGFLETEDWSMFNGAGQAVIRTESMSAKDLEDALCHAQESWLLFNAKRSVFGNYGGKRIHYLKKAARDPIKAIKYLKAYIKGPRK